MLFSIIVPMYNVQEYARECIESIIQQTYSDFELIIVNDGSTDLTGQIISEYSSKNERIKVINKPNGGLVSARKAGIAVSSGDYIVTVDGDDWVEKHALAVVASFLKEYEADIVSFGYYKAQDSSAKTAVPITETVSILDKADIHRILLPQFFSAKGHCYGIPNLWNKVIRRELYLKYSALVDNRITMGEDGAITYPCMYEANCICLLPNVLYNYRLSPNSMTRNKAKYLSWESADLRIKHYVDIFSQDEKMYAHISRFAIHAYFNVILSHMKNEPYRKVQKETLEKLQSSELKRLIKVSGYNHGIKQGLAKFALQYRQIWMIKLYSMLV